MLPECVARLPRLAELSILENPLRDIPRFEGAYASLRLLGADAQSLSNECLAWLAEKDYFS